MNSKQFFAVAAIALIGPVAMAQETTPSIPTHGTVTRAQVKADLARAIADGSIERRNESAYSARAITAPAATGRTREEVRAEARGAARTAKNANSPYAGS